MKPATRRIFLVNKEDAMFGAKYGDVYKQFKKLNENYNLKSNVNSLENQLKQIEQQTQMLHTNTQEHAKKYDFDGAIPLERGYLSHPLRHLARCTQTPCASHLGELREGHVT